MQLFHETFNDALREVLAACGGAKQVAAKLWPEKTMDTAHKQLLDCMNEARDARLDPDRLRMVLRMGRDVGCHAATNWMLRDMGYEDAKPVEPEDLQAKEMREFVSATKALLAMSTRLEARLPLRN